MRSKIRDRLKKGEVSIGTWLNLASPLAAEVMACVGFDWLAVDAEHSAVGLAQITEIFRATESRGATPIVRAWDHRYETLGRLLDAGAFGVVVPHVSTRDQAVAITQACRFPPRGKRSLGTGRWLTLGLDYMNWFNDELVVIAQIEDAAGIENCEAIMAVEGVDIGFLGPSDLAMDLGVPFGSPKHEQAIQHFLAVCKKIGKPCGLPVGSGKAVRERQAQGFVFFDINADMGFLETEAKKQLNEARGL